VSIVNRAGFKNLSVYLTVWIDSANYVLMRVPVRKKTRSWATA